MSHLLYVLKILFTFQYIFNLLQLSNKPVSLILSVDFLTMDTPLLEEDALAGTEETSPRAGRPSSLPLRNSVQSTRPSYLQSLLREGHVPSLYLENNDDITEDNEGFEHNNDNNTPNNNPSTMHMDVPELRRRFTSMRDVGERPTTTSPLLAQVEVRMKDYSYHVPIRVDAPSIKTVFNQSPCYVGTNFIKNVGELITGQRKVS